jgi:hypothetical protein
MFYRSSNINVLMIGDNMRDLFEQIKRTMDYNLYYVAFSMCLIIPDICGAMSYTNGKSEAKRYIEWFDKYVGSEYDSFNGKDCYNLRCGLVHQGRSANDKSRYKRVLFLEPGATPYSFHKVVVNDVYLIELRQFCYDILKGAENWISEYESKQVYIDNYNKSIKIYPNGLSNYIVGAPVRLSSKIQ